MAFNFMLNKFKKTDLLIPVVLVEFVAVLTVTAISWMNIYSKKVFLLWAIPHFVTTLLVLILLLDKKNWVGKTVSFYISGFLASAVLSYVAIDCLVSTETTYEIIMRLLPLYIFIAFPVLIGVVGFVFMGIYVIVKKIQGIKTDL